MATRRRVTWALGCGLLALLAAGTSVYWVAGGEEDIRGLRARSRYPRVVLVTFDTLNIWYTSLFSEDGPPTPNLAALAADGVLFEHAYTSVPVTLPSHTALLSGRRPWSTGVLANGDRVPEELVTLPEILSEHGYRTAAFLSLGVLTTKANLDQGFDHYDPVPGRTVHRWYRTADEVFEPAAEWVRSQGESPFFLWLHLSDPHAPYLPVGSPPDAEARLDDRVIGRWTLGLRERSRVSFELPPGRHRLTWTALAHGNDAPIPVLDVRDGFALRRWVANPLEREAGPRRLDPEWSIDLVNEGTEEVEVVLPFQGRLEDQGARWVRARYGQEVSYADRYLGRLRGLMNEQGLAKDTLWVVASDHGEGLFHHGILGHGPNNREEQLRTLLMFSGETVPPGTRIESPPVLLIDTLPTILELLGLPLPEDAEGKSLVGCWERGERRPLRREWITYGVDKQRSLRSVSVFRWPLKAIWSMRSDPGIFDVREDPRERHPVVRLSAKPGGLMDRVPGLDEPLSDLVERLEQSVQALGRVIERTEDRELTPEDVEMLESLGYL